jgi:uncharacterized protein YacL
MKVTPPLVSLLSAIIAAIVSHFITRRIIELVTSRADHQRHFLTVLPGSAILFAVVFVVVWFVVSLIIFVPWFLRKHKSRSA